MKVIWQEPAPVAPDACSVQLPDIPNALAVGADVNPTVPVGVVALLDAVSFTVAVRDVALPVVTDVGEQATVVADGSMDVTGDEAPLLVESVLSPP